jgi:hypothetical protein
MNYKRNQLEEAILRTLGAQGPRADELRFRIKRLLMADRRMRKSDKDNGRRYAFFKEKPPGTGADVGFSEYEVLAMYAALKLLEHGLPQSSVVRVMRRAREHLEMAHSQTLAKDPAVIFDERAIQAQAKPGMIATSSTDPVFLAIADVTGSTVDKQRSHRDVAVCQGHVELSVFLKKRLSVLGSGATFIDLARPMHVLSANLVRTQPAKRGRGAS